NTENAPRAEFFGLSAPPLRLHQRPQTRQHLRQRPLAQPELGAVSRPRRPVPVHTHRVGRLTDPRPLRVQRLVEPPEPRLHPFLALGVILPDRPDAAVADTLRHGGNNRPRRPYMAPIETGVFLADLFLL